MAGVFLRVERYGEMEISTGGRVEAKYLTPKINAVYGWAVLCFIKM